ncbi:mechanosensitive ion channel family protein [Oscillatoriales cyanobacterium LEGE 11467]|uniref:Mechanosensitive ion channel family protein n=1 Tax=Zarconia navalis LEGE 11467 TaxID=1828826 RepID=A0A928VZ98_9CYAN|nr:mechanosensitive ion channel family protein [Zarconia navalis]MBE9041582.1 mechanosensitive ion channel family protein [Zarconia navalis LEGE 11467]
MTKICHPFQRQSIVAIGIAFGLSLSLLGHSYLLPAWGQESAPQLPGLNLEKIERFLVPSKPANIDTAVVRLDGRKLFYITAVSIAPDAESPNVFLPIRERVGEIEATLQAFVNSDFDPETLEVTFKIINNLPVIYANDRPLLTVTVEDGRIYGVEAQERAEYLTRKIKTALLRGKRERQPKFIQQQIQIAGCILLAAFGASLILTGSHRYFKRHRSKQQIPPPAVALTDTADISEAEIAMAQYEDRRRQQRIMNAVVRRLVQVSQIAIWGGSIFAILGLFAQTRGLQTPILTAIRVPLLLLSVGLATYIVIRLSSVAIGRFFWALEGSQFLTPEASRRLVLRITTFSQVFKGVAAAICTGIGAIAGLSVIGIPVAPLLAGAGIIGIAFSLASQSVIKDTINGFLILLEDQFAVGDVVILGEAKGFVENMNLRITQLRNEEGELITIPNSAISIVRNLSKEWSRVDLSIPIALNADLDKALKAIEEVALNMCADRTWQGVILEPPLLLGVDKLDRAGATIRLWIKTQPLKQWEIAREYRRRLKLELDRLGIELAMPQQALWIQGREPFPANGDRHAARID